MAKRRKTKKSKMSGVRRRRSRVSGIGAIDFMNIIAVAGGAVAGGLVNKFVPATMCAETGFKCFFIFKPSAEEVVITKISFGFAIF